MARRGPAPRGSPRVAGTPRGGRRADGIFRAAVLLAACACAAAASPGRRVATPAELKQAIAAAKPGDVILMAAREWRDADIEFSGDGLPGKPITLRAETPGRTLLTGRSRLHIAGRYLVVSGLRFANGWVKGRAIEFRSRRKRPAYHCRLTQCAVIGYNSPDKKLFSCWIALYGRHNRVDHCWLEGKTNIGSSLIVWVYEDLNYHRIDHNYFGPRPRLGWNGGETIRIGLSARSMRNSRTTVECNYFYDCSGEDEIISSKSCENVFRWNTFDRCGGALTLRHGDRNLVEGNFFLGRRWWGAGGVRVTGDDHKIVNNYFCELGGRSARAAVSLMNGIVDSPLAGYRQVRRAIVAFNTFIDCRESLHIGLSASPQRPLPPVDCLVANNLFFVSHKQPVVAAHCSLAGVKWQGNLAEAPALGVPARPGLRLVPSAGLARGADGLWRPGPASPAIGAAEGDFAWVTRDIDGQARRGRKDVGCDQRSDDPILHRPLTRRDVGPSWLSKSE